MKSTIPRTLRIIAAAVFALAFSPAVMAQSARDIERAENERDLDLRSWNLKILQLQHERERKGRPPVKQALRAKPYLPWCWRSWPRRV